MFLIAREESSCRAIAPNSRRDHLERAVGLGNRERRHGSASERARRNVQRRLHHALQRIKR